MKRARGLHVISARAISRSERDPDESLEPVRTKPCGRSNNKSRLGRIWIALFLSAAGLSIVATDADADSRIVVALGASQTAGKGLSHDQAFPAQLEGMLHAKGYDVRVLNEGTSGDTTSGMLNRLDQAIPSGTKVVVLQTGGNDWRKGRSGDRTANISEIKRRLQTRGIKIIILENGIFGRLPKQPDRQHLTPEGYRAVAAHLLPQVMRALGP
jgi:acyl-CoA thioesterase I